MVLDVMQPLFQMARKVSTRGDLRCRVAQHAQRTGRTTRLASKTNTWIGGPSKSAWIHVPARPVTVAFAKPVPTPNPRRLSFRPCSVRISQSTVPSCRPPASCPAKPRTAASRVKQVRIVATIGTTPIYEREVREAVYQRLPEFIGLPASLREGQATVDVQGRIAAARRTRWFSTNYS